MNSHDCANQLKLKYGFTIRPAYGGYGTVCLSFTAARYFTHHACLKVK